MSFELTGIDTRAESETGVPYLPQRAACLLVVAILSVVSVAAYFQSSLLKDLWPWQDHAMTYRFAAAYLFAFAGSLLWVAITGEMAALTGVSLTVIVNAAGMTAFLIVYSVRHETTELLLNILGMILILVSGLFAFRWSRRIPAIRTNPTPAILRTAMVIFPIVLIFASVRLIFQSTNVFPWDPQPQWSTIIGLCLLGSVVYFTYGAFMGIWAHAGGQFAGFLAYDLVLIPPYLRLLREEETASTNASGFTTYASTVNDGPLYIFLTAIAISLVLSVWYLLFDRRTRVFGS